ncbi:MAG: hypothetical protein ABI181_15150 [Mycobacteriaceae bacterium]
MSTSVRPQDAPTPAVAPHSAVRADLWAGGLGLALVAAAGVVPHLLTPDPRAELNTKVAPILADFAPHVGWGTPFAVLVAVATVAWGPAVAARLGWRPLLGSAYLATVAWGFSLAMVDGWQRGFADNLTTSDEYLSQVYKVHGVHELLSTFTSAIVERPGAWTVHASAHPPLILLFYAGLDRIGLGGGIWASTITAAIGASATVAVLIAVRALAGRHGFPGPSGEGLARRAAPFLVLAPTATWVFVSADGLFAAVAAWGIALLALAATRSVRRPWLAALGSGVVLGVGVYLSYGLILMALPAVAVLVAARTTRPLLPALVGALAVAALVTAAGFWWWEGYQLVITRYYQGIATRRTYSYWLWGNVAALVVMAGLASVAGVRRALAPARLRAREGLSMLVLGALAAAAYADVSGLSRSETERIWLPFGVWLVAAAALLPRRHHRAWLAVAAVSALGVNHLLRTAW